MSKKGIFTTLRVTDGDKKKKLICEMNAKKLEQNYVTEGKLSKMTTDPFVCNDKCFLVKN